MNIHLRKFSVLIFCYFFCLTALIWRCLGVGAWVWHDGYVHVFRVVLFSESVVLSCGEAALSVGAVRAGFRRARGLSDGSENRPLITNPPERVIASSWP